MVHKSNYGRRTKRKAIRRGSGRNVSRRRETGRRVKPPQRVIGRPVTPRPKPKERVSAPRRRRQRRITLPYR